MTTELEARIKDLSVDVKQRLSTTVQKNLVEIINREFDRQATIYNVEQNRKREEILDEYRKQIGFGLMVRQYNLHKQKMESERDKMKKIEDRVKSFGLDVQGNQYFQRHNDPKPDSKTLKAISKLNELLQAVALAGPANIRNKIISRLWLASTVGEAMVILREVLGNGIIPTLSKEEAGQLTDQSN